ncbi:MAG: penicillin-binding protein 1C [Saprospiraceae bacterium]|nr:penicillin-binding protein 1C [Saprospiraceae bacterium]
MKAIKFTYGLLFILVFWLLMPTDNPLDNKLHSFVLFDKNDELLGARIASDEQWRFPMLDTIPAKFEKAILTFEDKSFYDHIGFDVKAFLRAIYLNVKHQKVVSGGSTITMQLMRMENPHARRTIFRKAFEIFGALKYETKYSKEYILKQYCTHAPFGGNIVGLETASWRYLGKSPEHLSWAESCMLAVLPNAPSLIHPGKNRNRLLAKRNKLLLQLHEQNVIDKMTYELSLLEPIVPRPEPLPNLAPHFLEHVKRNSSYMRYYSAVEFDKQTMLSHVVERHNRINRDKGIFNAGAVIVDNKSRSVVAYIGNTNGRLHENYNDMVLRPRSSGSILKPILYSLAINEGQIMPEGLAYDVPISINGFSPKNYTRDYYGAIPYNEVLSKSLNVPSVKLLQNYGVNKFLNDLRMLGFTTLNKEAEHYGLPLILGGAEVSLIDLVQVYSGMAKTLSTFNIKSSKYLENAFEEISWNKAISDDENVLSYDPKFMNAGSIWSTFQAMTHVERPNQEGQWEKFKSAMPIHWKTGTSYGNRDAWAIGVTPQFTVGVWVGNSDGQPHPDIIGVSAAGPLLFDIYNFLNVREVFEEPFDDMVEKQICNLSGMIAQENCDKISYKNVPLSCITNQVCHFHKHKIIDKHTGHLVYRNCGDPSSIRDTSFFVLPPVAAHYYKRHHPEYSVLPPIDRMCAKYSKQDGNIEFQYPVNETTIYIPRNLSGEKEKCVFKANHKDENAQIFWHLNNDYLGTTKEIHHFAVDLNSGDYTLTLQDEFGTSLSKKIKVISP